MRNLVESLLGRSIYIKRLSNKELRFLPLGLQVQYDYYSIKTEGGEMVLIREDSSENNGRVKLYRKHRQQCEEAFGKAVVFYMPPIPAYVRFRYIREGLPFISEDGSANIPGLVRMSLKAVANQQPEREKLSPLAQVIILRELLQQDVDGSTQAELASKFQCSRMAICQALKELKTLRVAHYDKWVQMELRGEQLWKEARFAMENPVRKVLYLKSKQTLPGSLPAGESALSRQTLLAAPDVPVRALGRQAYQKLRNHIDFTPCNHIEEAGQLLQIWRYNPELLVSPESDCVDSLSLFLSLEHHADDRVQQELEQLVFPWS